MLPEIPPFPHSCYPTCGITADNTLVWLRSTDRCAGITIDYATLYLGPEPRFVCRCGHIGCRRNILGFNFLPVSLQDFYLEKNVVSKVVLQMSHLHGGVLKHVVAGQTNSLASFI